MRMSDLGRQGTESAASESGAAPNLPDAPDPSDDAGPGPESRPEPPRGRAWLPSRRQFLSHGVAVTGALVVGSVAGTKIERVREAEIPPPGPPSRVLLDDASELQSTQVRGITFANTSTEETAQRLAP